MIIAFRRFQQPLGGRVTKGMKLHACDCMVSAHSASTGPFRRLLDFSCATRLRATVATDREGKQLSCILCASPPFPGIPSYDGHQRLRRSTSSRMDRVMSHILVVTHSPPPAKTWRDDSTRPRGPPFSASCGICASHRACGIQMHAYISDCHCRALKISKG